MSIRAVPRAPAPRIPQNWRYYSIVSYYFRGMVADFNLATGNMPPYVDMRDMHRRAVARALVFGGRTTPVGRY